MHCTCSNGEIGKLSPVVSFVIRYILQPLEHEDKKYISIIVFMKIFVCCTDSKGDVGSIV